MTLSSTCDVLRILGYSPSAVTDVFISLNASFMHICYHTLGYVNMFSL